METQQKRTIVIVGAGILGLSSASLLVKSSRFSKYRILLVAADFSFDGPNLGYASTAAGAHYRPIPATTPQLKYEAGLANTTCERFKKLSLEHPEYGIQFMEGIEYVSGEAASAYKTLLPEYAQLTGFRVLDSNETPTGVEFAARYDTYTVDPDVYLFHLLRRFKLDGGEVQRTRLSSLQEAFDLQGHDVSLVINCSGMGFNDPHSFIIRGQTCLVSNTCNKTITRQDNEGWSFLIPRPLGGGTIVGGTKQPNDWSAVAVESTRETLLANAAKLYPAILNSEGKFDVIRDIVGRRPAREGGLRLEVEVLPSTAPLERKVVHAYGAGGRGVELSWGVAEEVVKMVQDSLPQTSHSRL
ncbi:hypothetical protein LOZ12_000462 [Ophidiomyces ophidiicola]|uniref:Uncharacterized protein n=1 Tax=Ophidiomyces ophidiicola TaxID=1387563 RepID=A0ACB8UN68_9EURO|nr:hypothetical protein LOZ61_004639 [Ophidiomyces ophidiicola]KAI1919503.1 hypothetical protein LOZ64_002198 [Ophidiomyces ophidiicola]KAI1924494.1 hypothetical protein LOZ60_004700 [Ophidiomyces ophidiicola]KAI1934923.1 hypothetical protein LOZ62_006126 [Ophidiomyces ophidiicola]KAI1967467.1 hypothetical protein LOZ59_000839 [Ophidiomyces ophidiicola]